MQLAAGADDQPVTSRAHVQGTRRVCCQYAHTPSCSSHYGRLNSAVLFSVDERSFSPCPHVRWTNLMNSTVLRTAQTSAVVTHMARPYHTMHVIM
jgi:hypothetical protein